MKASPIALVLALGLPVLAPAQQQKVTGPQARYWVSAETQTGISAMDGGGAAMMAAMMGGGGGSGPRKSVMLELTGTRAANPAEGTHSIPGGMNMGPALPLIGERSAAAAPEHERDIPRMDERPRGRMLFFWGCGESVGTGQPVVLDMAQMADGNVPANLRSTAVARDVPFRLLNSRGAGYANWPNQRDSKAVPANASLAGTHNVQGNLNPPIRFSVDGANDFMDALTLTRGKTGSGALKLSWNAAATATGYFATGFGAKQGGAGNDDMVMWNSSAVRLIGGESMMRFLPPAEVARLIREKVVLDAKTTECTVPKEVLAAAGGDLVMNNLNGFGPELNVVHPPRPTDPKADWNQEYAVKLRLRTTASAMAGMEDAGGRPSRATRAGADQGSAPDTGTARESGQDSSGGSTPADAAKSILRGIFGR